MATHHSLPINNLTGANTDTEGMWVPVAGRTGMDYPWTITVDAPYIGSGSVVVRLEAAGRQASEDVVTLHTFDALATPAQVSTEVTVSGYLAHGFLRTVAKVNGTVTVGTTEDAPFFTLAAEHGRFSDQMQTWSDLPEAILDAERDLLAPYPTTRGYELAMHHPRFGDDFKYAVARQVRHRFQKWALSRSQDAKSFLDAETEPMDRKARMTVAKYAPRAFF